MKRGQESANPFPHNLEFLNASHLRCRSIRAFLRNSHSSQPLFYQFATSPQSLP